MQIGVIGSAADLKPTKAAVLAARKLGVEIARRKHTLIFGAEQDCMSLSTFAALSARKEGGTTIGVTYGTSKRVFEPASATIVIPTGLIRGGGREMTQALACDGIVAIAGGSGTLNEITVAYQADIPVVLLKGFGGWSDQLSGMYLDARKRYVFNAVKSAAEALDLLETMIQSREGTNNELIDPTI